MKVSGFTFIRNAIKYDYPILEAIKSILPICDEFIVSVGHSEDKTFELMEGLAMESRKIRIIESVWNDDLREGGRVLAIETDKAFRAISPESDWAFYIQADEVLHEKYIEIVRENMIRYKDDSKVEGLLFNYVHFYGSYDYTAESTKWYRREIRVIKNNKNIFSYRDAQGFRKKPNEKLSVKLIDAAIYHYGWVKEPKVMQAKRLSFNKYWHDDAWVERYVANTEEFDYSNVDALAKFTGTHPAVMVRRIATVNWKFDRELSKNNLTFKERLRKLVETLTGWRPGEYRNYKII